MRSKDVCKKFKIDQATLLALRRRGWLKNSIKAGREYEYDPVEIKDVLKRVIIRRLNGA